MRYHIDTIPLWDALKLGGECPLCAIRRKNELLEVQRFLGASVMAPDTRIQVNQKGFCARHQQMLYAQPNRLGHALMLHTHLKETQQRLAKTFVQLQEAGNQLQGVTGLGRLVGKGAVQAETVKACAQDIAAAAASCVICDSLRENMDRYVYTFLHLWKSDPEFKKATLSSKGFCLPDTALLLEAGREHLSPGLLGELCQALSKLTQKNLSRIEKELEWFTLKFDYRNQDKPWGDSKDAVERTCNKLRGWCAGEEPNPKEK